MEQIFWIFLGIMGLFFMSLIFREFLSEKNKKKICAICFAVSFTWIFLLVMFWLDKFGGKTIISLMMGMTLLGIFYLWERNVKERALVFRLPFLLTLIIIGYSLIEGFSYGLSILVLLAILWIIFIFVYLYGSKKKSGSLVRKLVECCKKW